VHCITGVVSALGYMNIITTWLTRRRGFDPAGAAARTGEVGRTEGMGACGDGSRTVGTGDTFCLSGTSAGVVAEEGGRGAMLAEELVECSEAPPPSPLVFFFLSLSLTTLTWRFVGAGQKYVSRQNVFSHKPPLSTLSFQPHTSV